MKRLFITILMVAAFFGVSAQSCYWVVLTDKQGSTFDPYSYFDAKAIERYRLNNADLYDISNYPLSENYVHQINAIATEEIGQSRWLNAIAVMATDEQIEQINKLPFVKQTDMIASDMQIAAYRLNHKKNTASKKEFSLQDSENEISEQLLRMRGDLFIKKGIDGSGVRIAVFDGGFKAVNTHQAFKHLRDNGQIIATWDFTKKQSNVYDNHTHGTMVLSCIAGIINGTQLGLATGSTFLLAKTEVDPEPFKEEVWWAQAVEWADKNGADVINSSLGYGADRHFTHEMDGRSYVAKAAELAAKKGMLVCNSAGNEGDDDEWKCIITPADAENVLAVGGIIPSLESYGHIYFSSFGPTADGRMKPNVCNFGYCEVADPFNDDETDYAAGTSFASPLTAGFAACAWQTQRDKTAMQMKSLIEQSADLYPYYDYALGYGVPQASFFTSTSSNKLSETTFEFYNFEDYILIRPTKSLKSNKTDNGNSELAVFDTIEREDNVMMKIQNNDGLIEQYVNIGIEDFTDDKEVAVAKSGIWGYTLVVNVNGETKSLRLTKADSLEYADYDHMFEYYVIDTAGYILSEYNEHTKRTLADNKTSKWGIGKKFLGETYLQYGVSHFPNDELRYCDAFNFGVRVMRNFRKWYSLGLAFNINFSDFRYKEEQATIWDNELGIGGNDFSHATQKIFNLTEFNLEFFQRIRFTTFGEKDIKGLHWDIGVFGGLIVDDYRIVYNDEQNNGTCKMETDVYSSFDSTKLFSWGFTTRLAWNKLGVYGRYRMTQTNLPRLQIGLQYTF